jgi:hypothetical protein
VSVNKKALTISPVNFRHAVKIKCLSHVLNRIGQRLAAPEAQDYVSQLNMLMAHSGNARAAYRARTGSTWPTPSNVRWYAWIANYKAVLQHFAHIDALVRTAQFRDTASSLKMVALFQAHASRIKVQLIALCHFGGILERACYDLEGDGQLSFKAGALYRAAEASIREGLAGALPVAQQVGALVQAEVHDPAEQQVRLVQYNGYVEAMLVPARTYMAKQRLKNTTTLAVFALARIWDPSCGLIPTAEGLRNLVEAARQPALNGARDHDQTARLRWAIPATWLTDEELDNLIRELPLYVADLEENNYPVDSIKNILNYWRIRVDKLPTWAKFACKFALMKPSSAGIERVWSVFTRFFTDEHVTEALMDYIELVLKVQYNHRSEDGGPQVPTA